jgi:hypothetical protein
LQSEINLAPLVYHVGPLVVLEMVGLLFFASLYENEIDIQVMVDVV